MSVSSLFLSDTLHGPNWIRNRNPLNQSWCYCGKWPAHDTCLGFLSPIMVHWHGLAGVVVQYGRWHGVQPSSISAPISWNGLCFFFVMYLLSFWDCPCGCRWLTLLSGSAPLIKPRRHSLIFCKTTPGSLVSFSIPSLSPSLSLFFQSIEDHNVRCWRPTSDPDPYRWLPSCQRQQCGTALQTAWYDQRIYDKTLVHLLLLSKKGKIKMNFIRPV